MLKAVTSKAAIGSIAGLCMGVLIALFRQRKLIKSSSWLGGVQLQTLQHDKWLTHILVELKPHIEVNTFRNIVQKMDNIANIAFIKFKNPQHVVLFTDISRDVKLIKNTVNASFVSHDVKQSFFNAADGLILSLQ